MTDTQTAPTKFFFLAYLMATNQGVPVFSLNSVVSQTQRDLVGASLANIQDTAAQMFNESGVQFDNVVIQNIIFLAECTEEQFMRMQEVQQPSAEGQDESVQSASDGVSGE